MKLVYSFAKRGQDAEYWCDELARCSTAEWELIPFNHGEYIQARDCTRAQLLDNAFFGAHPGLLRLYRDLEHLLAYNKADVLLVDNYPPYHPEFLRKLDVYKVLRINDGPITAYDRDLAYLHAYDHVLYHTAAYSEHITMPDKLRYCGVKRCDYWPLALFEKMYDPSKTIDDVLEASRDIDIIYIGAMHFNKMPLLAKVKKAFRGRCKIYGLGSLKRNVYFNAMHGFPGWIRPISVDQYVPLYQRAKIGFNVHNRGKFTVGSYRTFDLPANGVMQISDGGEYLSQFYDVGNEIIGYDTPDELIDKLNYYLEHDDERERIARNAYNRTTRDHHMSTRIGQLFDLMQRALDQRLTDNDKPYARRA
jgi:spore maturation protein CgeB